MARPRWAAARDATGRAPPPAPDSRVAAWPRTSAVENRVQIAITVHEASAFGET
jgi:hypothetical protein